MMQSVHWTRKDYGMNMQSSRGTVLTLFVIDREPVLPQRKLLVEQRKWPAQFQLAISELIVLP